MSEWKCACPCHSQLASAEESASKAAKRADLLWRIVADHQDKHGAVEAAECEATLNAFDKELDALVAENIANEPERTKAVRAELEPQILRAEAATHAAEARLDAQTVTLERMRGALEDIKQGVTDDGEVCHSCLSIEKASAALASTPVSAGEALLQASRALFDLGTGSSREALESEDFVRLFNAAVAARQAELAERGGK